MQTFKTFIPKKNLNKILNVMLCYEWNF